MHGLCRSDLQWERDGHDHGAAIAADPAFEPRVHAGVPALQLRAATSRPTAGSSRASLDSLVRAWPVPVEEIAILAHSMGGLVARSALHYAAESRRAWPGKVTKIVFLGTPHDGAPLERGGNWVTVVLDKSPYTTAFSRLGKLRSAGITDLRHGNLLDDDWMGKDRFAASTRVDLEAATRAVARGRAVLRGRRLARAQERGACASASSATGWCRCPARSGTAARPRARSGSPPSGNGSATA